MSTYRAVNTRLAYCLDSVLNVKALEGAFNQESMGLLCELEIFAKVRFQL